MAQVTVDEPFPISLIAGRYLIFGVHTITYIRREHHIPGVLLGNIPQASQQNVFNGIPVELMPEEARLLVAKGHAYVVDDVSAHREQVKNLSPQERKSYLSGLEARGLEAAQAARDLADFRKAQALAKHKTNQKPKNKPAVDVQDDVLFAQPKETSLSPSQSKQIAVVPFPITPTTSYPPLDPSKAEIHGFIPEAPTSYDLYEYLHSKGYFLSPGLRFGCQYLAYPGDPLRFHSHFLATSKEWDEPIDLLDIVGGGRLGTGVKKGYLLGGVEENDDKRSQEKKTVRAFCFEWAAM